MSEQYPGWTNAETAKAASCCDNDDGLDAYIQDEASQCHDKAFAEPDGTSEEKQRQAVHALERKIRVKFYGQVDGKSLGGLQTDDLKKVNWREIAEYQYL